MDGKKNEDIEEQNEETIAPPPKPATSGEIAFRYACPACTGIAYYSTGQQAHVTNVCQNCGKSLPSFEPDRLIALTDSEKESLKQLAI